MTSYYYLDDPDSEEGSTPITEDDYISALYKIAKENRIRITDKMILEKVFGKPERTEKPSKYLIKALRESEEQRKRGKYKSFKSPDEAMNFIDKIIDEKH